MGETFRLFVRITLGLAVLAVAVWFGAMLFFLVLGLIGVAFILQWLRRQGIVGYGTPDTSYTHLREESRHGTGGEGPVTVIETEYHEVKDERKHS